MVRYVALGAGLKESRQLMTGAKRGQISGECLCKLFSTI
jgi:hypothetical protein